MDYGVMRDNFRSCLDWIHENIMNDVDDQVVVVEACRLSRSDLTLYMRVKTDCIDFYWFFGEGREWRTEEDMRDNIDSDFVREFLVNWRNTKKCLSDEAQRIKYENAMIGENFEV